MKSIVNSVTNLDILFLTKIFKLDGKKLFSAVIPWVSHSGNGYYYPLLPFFIYFYNPSKAFSFLMTGLAAFAIELPLYKILKTLVKRERPCKALENVHNRISPSDRFSFPSGHTAAAILMAVLISYFFPVLMVPAFIWATLVGFSRIYLGVHYPTDILAGIAIGLLCGLIGLLIAG